MPFLGVNYIDENKVDKVTAERLKRLLKKTCRSYWIRKRIFDILVSSIICLIVLIPSLIVLLIIFLEDTHVSPIYQQDRVGRHGEIFKLYKFRTMIAGADKIKAEIMDRNEMTGGPVFKMKDDPRVTRFGKILRRLSVDELPQFINVFKGDMSVVGPRPALPSEVEEYTDYQRLRLLVTPGITCTWQITPNRNDVSFDKWVEMDLRYIETRSFFGDMWIIIRTPFAMLRNDGR